MKKTGILRALTLAAALLVALMTFVACDAAGNAPNDMYPSLGPADQNSAGGMEGGGNAGGLVGGPVTDNRKIIRTVSMTCETKAYDDAITTVMTALATYGGYV
jgi:hypothetical protein